MPTWLILLLIVAAGISVAMFLLFKVSQKRSYQAFAKASHLDLDHFINARNFSMKGTYSGYPIAIKDWVPPQAPDQHTSTKGKWLRIDVPLSNPNKKFMRLSQGVEDQEWYELFNEPETATVQHSLGDSVSIVATDLWFSGYVLGEEGIERAGVLFKHAPQAMVAIQGDALFAVLPNTISNTKAWKPIAEAMTILTDIKNELNKDG